MSVEQRLFNILSLPLLRVAEKMHTKANPVANFQQGDIYIIKPTNSWVN